MRNAFTQPVIVASRFATLFTSVIFDSFHLLLPSLRPCSVDNPRESRGLLRLCPIFSSSRGQHYVCRLDRNSCYPLAVVVSFRSHFAEVHAPVIWRPGGVTNRPLHTQVITL